MRVACLLAAPAIAGWICGCGAASTAAAPPDASLREGASADAAAADRDAADASDGASASDGTISEEAASIERGDAIATATVDASRGVTVDGGTVTPTCEGGACGVCPAGSAATVTGRVLDPGGHNPVAHAVVFVPDPRAALPGLAGMPMPCGCDGLYPMTVLAVTSTDTDGRFTLADIPSPAVTNGALTVVAQVGKWRVRTTFSGVVTCASNGAPDVRLPSSGAEGDLPDIAISTGGADSLECLPIRMGIAASEYAPGGATADPDHHVRIFQGAQGPNTSTPAPQSSVSLYDTAGDLAAHDLVLFSCEGAETTGGNPGTPMTGAYQQNLYDYVRGGGRALTSHLHDAFFRSTKDGGAQGFASGNVLGAGAPVGTFQGSGSMPEMIDDAVTFPVDVDTAEPDGGPFAEGADLLAWLTGIGAVKGNLAFSEQFVRENVVSLNDPPTQEWLHLDPSVDSGTVIGASQLFTLDTPRSGSPGTCGRIAYSDVHVSGPPGSIVAIAPADYPDAGPGGGIVPEGCTNRPLTPQESALEYMLFNLSSCLGAGLPPLSPK